MFKKQMYQGDIGLILIDKLPNNLNFQKITKEGFVVAEGEVTFHKHILVADKFLAGEKISDCEIAQDVNGMYLKIMSGSATIKHEEHAPIQLGVGSYWITRQVEFDELKEYRQVMD